MLRRIRQGGYAGARCRLEKGPFCDGSHKTIEFDKINPQN
jgi:CDGSH-type Zn-finger protein